MAILKVGPLGGFTGKTGEAVCYMLNGKWVIRSLPTPSKKNKIGTAKQKAARAKFTIMQHFLGAVLYFIRVGFNLESKLQQNSAYNAAKSYNMLNAFNADGEIVYEQVCLSYGNLTGAVGVEVQSDDVGFHVTWTDNSYSSGDPTLLISSEDQVMLLAYDPVDKQSSFITAGATRGLGKETLALEEDLKGKSFHLWIAFISENRDRIATSTYLGEKTF